MPDASEAVRIPILDMSSKTPSPNPSVAINNDIVKPIPQSPAAPNNALQERSTGAVACSDFVESRAKSHIPTGLPRNNPSTTPMLTGCRTRTYVDRESFLRRSRSLLNWFQGASPDSYEARSALHSMQLQLELIESPLHRIEHWLHPWVGFLIMPRFCACELRGEDSRKCCGSAASSGWERYVGKPGRLNCMKTFWGLGTTQGTAKAN
jgi:hypothetical protein